MIIVSYNNVKREIEEYKVGLIKLAILDITNELTEQGYVVNRSKFDITIKNENNLLLTYPLLAKN